MDTISPLIQVKNPLASNILNLRDVGKTINGVTYKKLLLEGLLFRSARPDDATLLERKYLQDVLHIRTVMDLRTKSEHVKQSKKRRADLKVPALMKSNDALAEPSKIPGIDYLEININGKGFERSLLWQLSIWSFIKLIFLMLCGYRMQAISILGREVMQPRGLIGLGYDTIDHCGPEIAQAIRDFSRADRLPILVHCTQGKDRTGLLIALILFLLDVPIDAVTYDYCLSESELLPEMEQRLEEITEIGLTEDFAQAPKDWVPKLFCYLQEKYGGIKDYMSYIGIDVEAQERLISVLRGR